MAGNFFSDFAPDAAPAGMAASAQRENFFADFASPPAAVAPPAEVDEGRWQNPVMERIRQLTLAGAHAVAHPVDTAGNVISGAVSGAKLPGEVYRGEANLNDPATIDRAISLGLMISPGAPGAGGAAKAASAAPAVTAEAAIGRAPFALRRAAEGMTPANIEDAGKLIDAAKSQGIDLPWTQAIQEVSGGATNFTNLERYVGGTAGGAPLRQMMANRPAQVEAAGNKVLSTLQPQAPQLPVQAGLAAQDAARQSLLGEEAARTAATSPLYQAANPVKVDAPGMDKLLADMGQAIERDKTGVVTSEVKRLRDMISHVPPATAAQEIPFDLPSSVPAAARGPAPASLVAKREPHLDIENLNNARIVTQERLGMPQVGADAVTKKQSGAVSPFLGRLRMMMEQASPDFKAANQEFAGITKAVVKPEQAGPLGQIAKTPALANQGNALFPTGAAAVPGQEAVLGAAVKKLAARDPQAAESVVHAHLQSLFDVSTKGLQGGPNAMGGANFAKALMGNAQEARNARAVISALPNGRDRLAGVQKLVDVLRATGRAANAGSPTAPLQEIQREAKRGIIGTASSVLHPFQATREFAQKLEMGFNTERIAKIITDRNSAGLFRDLAKQRDPLSSKAAALAYKLISLPARTPPSMARFIQAPQPRQEPSGIQ